jgi:hypothetical protein
MSEPKEMDVDVTPPKEPEVEAEAETPAEDGEVKVEDGEVKEEVGEVKEEVGEVKEEAGEVKEEAGEVKEEAGEVKEPEAVEAEAGGETSTGTSESNSNSASASDQKPAAEKSDEGDEAATAEDASPKTTPEEDDQEQEGPSPVDEPESENAMDVEVEVDSTELAAKQEEEPAEEEGGETTVTNPPSQEDNTDAQYEKSYSTRGRAGVSDAASEALGLERLARDALSDLAKEKETPIASGASFLSDALTEEERRTRTRYLPEVEGMHALRKNEIKGDLALARSIQSSTGVAGTVAVSKSKAKRAREEEGMEGVEDEGASPSEESDRMSDSARLGSKTGESGTGDVVVRSTAFVAPPATSNGDGTSKREKPLPHEIEAVTAFNPPRPPESIGAKKKHRMLRWERRPADIEVDLSNYRKTVHRTREELKNAEGERERIETAENHLRRHFFNHLKCLNQEWMQLNEELATAHQECVDVADLSTSRTRSRGAGKASYAMKDVLGVLRSRGAEIDEKGLSLDKAPSMATEPNTPGAGGVGALSFKDWDWTTVIAPGKAAAAWLVPGDKVKTPYGMGTVVAVCGSSGLNVKEAPHAALLTKTSVARAPSRSENKDASDAPMPDADSEKSDTPMPDADSEKSKKKQRQSAKKKSDGASKSGASLKNMLAPRVAVQLPFGIGFFNLDSCVSVEDPSRYSDVRLASRWKGMVETAATFGATLDIEAMAVIKAAEPGGDPMDTSGSMPVDEVTGAVEGTGPTRKEGTPRLVPFGSGLLPTASGRGTLLADIGLVELDSELNTALSNGGGVLGLPDNKAVPKDVRALEVQRQEYLDLQARVLQLRNEMYRQRRTRVLNERTFAATQERSSRVEALVAETRSDLKSLKSRLDEEIRDLGISERQAENLLTSFYLSLDSRHSGQASPPKRPRKHQSRVYQNEDDEMDEEVVENTSTEKGTSKQ